MIIEILPTAIVVAAVVWWFAVLLPVLREVRGLDRRISDIERQTERTSERVREVLPPPFASAKLHDGAIPPDLPPITENTYDYRRPIAPKVPR